jgi:hypothetical protein
MHWLEMHCECQCKSNGINAVPDGGAPVSCRAPFSCRRGAAFWLAVFREFENVSALIQN